jgi:ethanolamine ammonia-lyase small subunit
MFVEDPWTRLRELTMARIALGRAGHSLPTRELLAFQLAHARARDAVHQSLHPAAFASLGALYLRRLDTESAGPIERGDWDLAIIIADGLSAIAVDRHALVVVGALLAELDSWKVGPVCVVEQGRVAIGDEIGERMGARLAVVLIGERPGLSSPDSLGAYITHAPRIGRTDAERNCVSNIRPEGLDPVLGAQRVAALLRAARAQGITGVGLGTQALTGEH